MPSAICHPEHSDKLKYKVGGESGKTGADCYSEQRLFAIAENESDDESCG